MKIAYVTDSGTGKSINDFASDGIISIPLQITDGTHTYQDMETLTKNQCIEELKKKAVLKTSQPSPGLIEDCFQSLKDNGTDLIIAVPICNGLSGTGSTMSAIAQQLEIPILCVETYTTAVVQDYLVHRIKDYYQEGKDDIQTGLMIEQVVDSAETIVIPVDLISLSRGGRLTPNAARLAKLLRIVPILHLNKETGGRIDILEKVMTMRKAMNRVVEHMKEKPIDETWTVQIAHTDALDSAKLMYEKVIEAFPTAKVEIIELCNVVSAQAGLGCLALQYFKQV